MLHGAVRTTMWGEQIQSSGCCSLSNGTWSMGSRGPQLAKCNNGFTDPHFNPFHTWSHSRISIGLFKGASMHSHKFITKEQRSKSNKGQRGTWKERSYQEYAQTPTTFKQLQKYTTMIKAHTVHMVKVHQGIPARVSSPDPS